MPFTSQYVNKLDSKLRVSIPAPYRAELMQNGRREVVVLVALDGRCIEIRRPEFLDLLVANTLAHPEGTDDRDYFVNWAGECETVSIDPEGRIVLPADKRSEVGIGGEGAELVFVGSVDFIRVWAPDRWKAARQEFRRTAILDRRPLREDLPTMKPSGTA